MHLCVFEDAAYTNFYPLTYLRPTFQLRCGLFTLSERIIRAFGVDNTSYICRPYLNPTLREQNLRLLSPFDVKESVLFVNGCILDPYALCDELSQMGSKDWLLVSEDRLIAAQLSAEWAQQAAYYLLEQNTPKLVESLSMQVEIMDFPAQLATYAWDFITHNPAIITKDFQRTGIRGAVLGTLDRHAATYNDADIFVGQGAQIDAMAVLDAREGPVYIAEGVKIQPFSYIQGPVFIGAQTQIVGGQIREGTSIGPVCRIGGEVEESIIQGYTNKYHAGFVGHSYLAEWVNIGAIGTNSDLKNTYGTIRVEVNDSLLDTRLQKFGIIVGDHAKIGIGTMVMAGTVIGVGSNIMGRSVPKVVPSFVWGGEDGGFAEYRIDKCIEVATATMGRRSLKLTTSQSNLLSHVFYQTARQRQPMVE